MWPSAYLRGDNPDFMSGALILNPRSFFLMSTHIFTRSHRKVYRDMGQRGEQCKPLAQYARLDGVLHLVNVYLIYLHLMSALFSVLHT